MMHHAVTQVSIGDLGLQRHHQTQVFVIMGHLVIKL